MVMMSLAGIYPRMKKPLPGIDLPCLISNREKASSLGTPGIGMMASVEAILPRQGNTSQRQEFMAEEVIRGRMAVPKTLNRYGYCWVNPMVLVDLNEHGLNG